MRLFGRRQAMKSAPVAVVGAGMVASNLTGSGGSAGYPSPGATKGLLAEAGSQLRRAVIPKEMAQYDAARQSFAAIQHYRYQRKSLLSDGRHGIDLDIQVLKSVSMQHKAAMQIARQNREREEEKTFFEKLASTLGLTEFLNRGMESINTDDAAETYPQARQNRY